MSKNSNKIHFNIPQNADKILFAEDFVNYSLTQFSLPTLPSSLERYRTRIHNAFNQTVIVAANCLYRRLERENLAEFENLRLHQPLDRNSFMNYVTSIEAEFLSWGFDAQKLLHFCVKTITMALKFYGSGFREGPALAAQRIVKALESFDMSSGGWDKLNIIAANYAKIYADVDKPSDSESEYESVSSSSSGESSESSNLVTTPIQANGIKHVNGRKCAELASGSHEYSSSELSEGSSSEAMCVEEEGNDSNTEVPYLQLDDKGFKDTNLPSCDAETTSDNETKRDEGDPGSASSNSVFFDTDEDRDSDDFEDSLNVENACNRVERRVAKKRPASSSSSASEFHVQDSMDKSDARGTSLSTTNAVDNEDLSSMEPACNVKTSDVEVSPVRKHVAKSRRKV